MEFGNIITPSIAFSRLLIIMFDNNLYEPFADVLKHETDVTEDNVIKNKESASISFEHVFEMIREIQQRITERGVKGLSIEEHESAIVQKLSTELYILRDEILTTYNPFDLIKKRIEESVDEVVALPSIQNFNDLNTFLTTKEIDMNIHQIEFNMYHLINEYIKKCFEEKSGKAPTSEMVIIQRDIIRNIQERNIPLPYFENTTIEFMSKTVSDSALSDQKVRKNKIDEAIDVAIEAEEIEHRFENDLGVDDAYDEDGLLIKEKLESFRKELQNQ